jgi:hypothetical protein
MSIRRGVSAWLAYAAANKDVAARNIIGLIGINFFLLSKFIKVRGTSI